MSIITKKKYNAVLDAMETDILIGTYRPRERLIESEIMEKHGITRNAVRNIFKELHVKGLVKHIPNRGVIVAEMGFREVKELYSMRILLEGYAAELVLSNIDESGLHDIIHAGNEFEKAVERKNFKDMVKTNIEFHQAIISVSGNSVLIDMINQMRNRAIVVRHYMWLQPDQIRKSVDEHRSLIEALRKRDIATFKKTNREHILAAYEQYTGEKYLDMPESEPEHRQM